MKSFLQESFIPVLVLIGGISVALIVLQHVAGVRSRASEIIEISAAEATWNTRPASSLAHIENESANTRFYESESMFSEKDGIDQGPVGRVMEMAAHDSLTEALDLVSSLLANNPHLGSAWFARGRILSQLGDREEAIKAYAKAVSYSGGVAKAVSFYNLGCAYRDAGQSDEAIKAFRKAIEHRPDYLEARLNLTILISRRDEMSDEALALYDQLLRLDPSYAQGYYNRGVLRMTAGLLDSALADFTRAIKLEPEFSKAWDNLGLLQSRRKHYEDAVSAYKRAIETDPDNKKARLNLAILLHKQMGRDDEALQLYNELIESDSLYAPAYYNRGTLWMTLDHPDFARADFIRTVKLDPGISKAWYNLGLLKSSSKEYEEAVAAYKHTIEIDPENTRARLNLAVALSRLERYEEAVEIYQSLIEKDPRNPRAWYNLAIAYTKLKQLREASRCYEKVLDMDPDNARAWQNLGVVYARQGKSLKAMECYREALAIEPTNTAARSNLALEYKRTGDLQAALEEANRLYSLAPEDQKARRFLKETAQMILEQNPSNREAQTILQKLQNDEGD